MVRGDLVAEQDSLDKLLSATDHGRWHTPTPSAGWDVADQIGHLAYFDRAASVAINDPEAFRSSVDQLVRGARLSGYDQYTLGDARARTPDELMDEWRRGRRSLFEVAQRLREDSRVEWYGPSMGATSFLTARLMETWAHGTDVADALEMTLAPTERLRHIAQLGYLTRAWSYRVRGEEPAAGAVRLELTGPSGDQWTWGPNDANDTVRGLAQDFCLVATQRRHLDDTSLVTGDLGRHWLLRAQAFAGGPTEGPRPRSFDEPR